MGDRERGISDGSQPAISAFRSPDGRSYCRPMELPKRRDYRDLVLWPAAAVELAAQTASRGRCADCPATSCSGLAAQIRRSAVSIPSNIAEGSGRRTTRRVHRHFCTSPAARCTELGPVAAGSQVAYVTRSEISVAVESDRRGRKASERRHPRATSPLRHLPSDYPPSPIPHPLFEHFRIPRHLRIPLELGHVGRELGERRLLRGTLRALGELRCHLRRHRVRRARHSRRRRPHRHWAARRCRG